MGKANKKKKKEEGEDKKEKLENFLIYIYKTRL